MLLSFSSLKENYFLMWNTIASNSKLHDSPLRDLPKWGGGGKTEEGAILM